MSRLNPEDPWLDTITFGTWLSRHGQSDAAIDRLWDLIALPTLNVHAREASLALAVKVFRTGLLDQADAGDVGWSTVPLTELHGDYAARALDGAGVATVLGARAQHVAAQADGGLQVVTDETTYGAEAVVVTTPPEVTQRLVPEGVLPDELGLGQSPIVNVHLVLDRQVTDLPLAAVVNSPIQFFFDRTASCGLQSGQCISISLSAADDYIAESSSQLVRTFFATLQALLPVARTARLVDGVVTRERAATFRATPGTAARRPTTRTSVPGLFLAVAGALRDGRRPWRAPCSAARAPPAPSRMMPAARCAASRDGGAVTASALSPNANYIAAATLAQRHGDRHAGARRGCHPPSPSLQAPVHHHLAGGGKRVPAASAPVSAAAAGVDESAGVPGAVAIELVHNFSLIHDDIIDEDTERRHRSTVWSEYGIGSAIIVGDAVGHACSPGPARRGHARAGARRPLPG